MRTAVPEQQIHDAVRALAARGLYAEPTSAVATAALSHFIADGTITPDQTTVVALTGSGVKSADKIASLIPDSACRPPAPTHRRPPMTADQTDRAPSAAGIHLRDSPGLIPPRGHYSHVAVHAGVAYISGQLPLDQTGSSLADQPFDVQVQQVLRNLDDCLSTAGSSREQLLSVTVYVTDIAQWPAFDAAYAQWLGDHRPARAVTGVTDLHYGAAIEVQAVAAVGPGRFVSRARSPQK